MNARHEGDMSIYLAGHFTAANGGVGRLHAAAVDLSTGALTAWDPEVNQDVHALQLDCRGAGIGIGGVGITRVGASPVGSAAILEDPVDCPASAVQIPDGGAPDGGSCGGGGVCNRTVRCGCQTLPPSALVACLVALRAIGSPRGSRARLGS
jgi:hypothetical protein